MGKLLSYSGISTKIRAMQSKLITEDQIQEMLQFTSTSHAAAWLKRTPEYSKTWASLDENSLHRGQIEKLLKASIFDDFSKIYQFASSEQRKFLDLYSRRYEIRVLKELMTNLFDHRDTDPVDLSPYREFFRRHSNLDLDALTACKTMDEFINALKGNEFYSPLSQIQNHDTALLFDYGMALEQITNAYGEKFDMLNLQFIFRSKRYFSMAPADIYALLIPMNYKLKKEEIRAIVEAATYEESQQLFRKTYYGKKYEHLSAHNLEEFYNYMLRSTLEKEARRDPYSVAMLYSYMYHKEHEVNRLTIAIECIRYGVAPDEAMQYIRNN